MAASPHLGRFSCVCLGWGGPSWRRLRRAGSAAAPGWLGSTCASAGPQRPPQGRAVPAPRPARARPPRCSRPLGCRGRQSPRHLPFVTQPVGTAPSLDLDTAGACSGLTRAAGAGRTDWAAQLAAQQQRGALARGALPRVRHGRGGSALERSRLSSRGRRPQGRWPGARGRGGRAGGGGGRALPRGAARTVLARGRGEGVPLPRCLRAGPGCAGPDTGPRRSSPATQSVPPRVPPPPGTPPPEGSRVSGTGSVDPVLTTWRSSLANGPGKKNRTRKRSKSLLKVIVGLDGNCLHFRLLWKI
nr:translation initiation factor IF-2-like [Saimiri boliviensis boliviensis]